MNWQSTVFLLEVAVILGVIVVMLVQHFRNEHLSLRKRVLVNLNDGKAMDGVLYARRGRLLVLRNVTLLEPGTNPVDVDGVVIVDRDRVDFVQASGADR